MARTKPPESLTAKPNAVSDPLHASSARWEASDWTKLPPEVRTHAEYLWAHASLDATNFDTALRDYPDSASARLIRHATCHGIRIRGDTLPQPYDLPNAPDATSLEGAPLVRAELHRQNDKYFRPPPHLRSIYIHRLGLVSTWEKSRVIHLLNLPRGDSINDHLTYVAYLWVRVTDAAARMYPGCRFIRIDIRDYYRNFLVDPADWILLAFRFGLDPDTTLLTEMWDCFMPFGGRNMVEFAHRVSTFLTWALGQLGINNVFTILDDFLIISTPGQTQTGVFDKACAFLRHLGFPLAGAAHKTHDFQSECDWYGLHLNGDTLQLSFTDAKLDRLLSLIDTALGQQINVTTALSLVGKLQNAGEVIWGVSTHIRPLLAWATHIESKHEPWHNIRATNESRTALRWMRNHLRANNGLKVVAGDPRPEIRGAADASDWGYGGVIADVRNDNTIELASIQWFSFRQPRGGTSTPSGRPDTRR